MTSLPISWHTSCLSHSHHRFLQEAIPTTPPLPEIRRGNPKKTILAFHSACDASLGARYDELPRNLCDPRWHARKHVEEKIIVNFEMTMNVNIKSNAWKSIIRFELIYKTLFYLSHTYGQAEIVQNMWIVKCLLRSMCNEKKLRALKFLLRKTWKLRSQ